jgi:hypothetical protein
MSVDQVINGDNKPSRLKKVNSKGSNISSDSDKTKWVDNEVILQHTNTPPSPPKKHSPSPSKSDEEPLFNKSIIESVNKNFILHLTNEIKRFNVVECYNKLLMNEKINLLDFTRFVSCVYYKLSRLEVNEMADVINKHLQCITQSQGACNQYLMYILTIIINIDFTKKRIPQTPLSFRAMYA